jgi:hypothetical protein
VLLYIGPENIPGQGPENKNIPDHGEEVQSFFELPHHTLQRDIIEVICKKGNQMKYISSILAVTILFSTSSFAANQITREESSGYTKIGELSVTDSGIPAVGNKELSQKINKKCQDLDDIKADDCYYLILDKNGNNTDHKNTDIEVFKK